jgi:hypothetical protein
MKRLFLLVLSVCLAAVSNASDPHKFYFSNTLVEYNSTTNSIEITMKLFTDDLERALEQQGHTGIKLNEQKQTNPIPAVRDYIAGRFSILFQGQIVYPGYLGQEVEYDLTVCYLELTQIPEYTFLEIRNQILTEVFADQRNVVDLRLNGWSQTLMFDRTTTSITVNK